MGMERLANRKAKEIHKIEEIRQAAQSNGDSQDTVNAKIEAVKLAAEKDTGILVSALSERGDKQKTKQENKILRAMNKLAEISIIEDHESAMESRIKDMESNHQNEVEGLHRKLKVEKNKQLDNLQKRLALRRKNARKGGVSSVRRQQIENEQQRANIEVRLRRRRSKNAAAGKKKGVDED